MNEYFQINQVYMIIFKNDRYPSDVCFGIVIRKDEHHVQFEMLTTKHDKLRWISYSDIAEAWPRYSNGQDGYITSTRCPRCATNIQQ